MPYRPLSVRDSESAEQSDYDGPHAGVPEWLQESLWNWVSLHVVNKLRSGPSPNAGALRAIERITRVRLDWTDSQFSALDSLENMALGKPELFLDVVDFLLSGSSDNERAAALEQLLMQAGAVYGVEERPEGGFQLCRRVSPEVRQLVDTAITASGRAGAHLRRAWAKTYGRTPDPSTGFREAVRAVEAVACPVAIPNDTMGTLGKVITRMKDAPQKFRINLTPHAGFDSIGAVRGMCELLWKSQFDRHGTADESVPPTVSQAECETALHLAATLVHWFATGRVTLVA